MQWRSSIATGYVSISSVRVTAGSLVPRNIGFLCDEAMDRCSGCKERGGNQEKMDGCFGDREQGRRQTVGAYPTGGRAGSQTYTTSHPRSIPHYFCTPPRSVSESALDRTRLERV
eukprot:3743656-Rhodomonas_salina.3